VMYQDESKKLNHYLNQSMKEKKAKVELE